jgi:hypothetical protein
MKMTSLLLQRSNYFIVCFFALLISATSCKKSNSSITTKDDTGKHIVDSRLVGKWMWTQNSDGAYYDNNGVYNGSAYGLASQYTINADGYGTCFNHMYSTIGTGTGLEVNISYNGFFESDDKGHFGFFPTSGTYKSSRGENRPLRADELWNSQTAKGAFLYQKLVFTTQGQRSCFQVTSSSGTVDTYYKVQ